ncbi:MAG: pre-rRNA-processing protein esf1 [Peltula sp. TS41687]|nr:MAG: pre-rRNA-processing protein esf1 [Peltula sp. TS41687]
MPKQKAPKGQSTSTQNSTTAITDPRFSHIHTDPRFRLPSKRQTHVALDARFAHMLHDEDFSRKASVDRYGRKIAKASGKKELERFYRLDDDDRQEKGGVEDGVDGVDVDDDGDVQRESGRVDRRVGYDPAREGGFSASSSSSESEEDSESEVGDGEEGDEDDVRAQRGDGYGYGLPDMQVEGQDDVPMGEMSARLAVVNLDWDNIRAVDLMAVFSSFCPPTGRILGVAVYPSQFGKERMDREETEGPPKEIFGRSGRGGAAVAKDSSESSGDDDDDNDNDEGKEEEEEEIKKTLLREDTGEEFDSTKLRRYQLERLRYFYAVLSMSSPETAKALYDATDGTEYLTTANFFDLRFVPDDVSFDDDRPRDECTAIPDGYRPNTFVTDALQHSKVKLTWDAEDNVRKEVVRRAFGGSRAEIEEMDLRAYLGSDTSEDEETPVQANGNGTGEGEVALSKKERERQRLRAALGLGDVSSPSASKRKDQDVPVGDMQITFTSGLSGKKKTDNEPEQEETTIEKYRRKEKERKLKHKEKITTTRNGQASNSDVHSHSKGRKHGDTEPNEPDNQQKSPELGFDDSFFTSAAAGAEESSRAKKAKRRRDDQTRQEDEVFTSQQKAELELLMLDDDPSATSKHADPTQSQGHFNMTDILRAEKKSRRDRNKKKPKHQDVERNDGGGGKHPTQQQQQQQQEGFSMDVSDPRFAALYQNHEFAIDPTNPRFKDTKAMRAVLDQARRKRGVVGDGEENNEGRDGRGDEGERKRGKRKRGGQDGDDEREGGRGKGDGAAEELKSLVEKVKRKVRRT